MSDSSCCSEPISYAAVEEDGTSGLVIQVFDDLDEVCADVVCYQLGLLGTDLHAIGCGGFVETLN